MKKLYNENLKNKFLEQYSKQSTKETYLHFFSKCFEMEDLVDKDLSQFSLRQISKLFEKEIKPTTTKVARANGSIVSTYINWAIENGDKEEHSPLKEIGYDWFDQFVNPENKIHFSDQEITEIEDKLMNAQDAIILRLLFEGIQGSNFSEILNIQKHHINFEDSTILVDDDEKGERLVKVSKRCIEIIKRALKEERYWNKNGTAKNEKRLYSLLIENDYLLRSNKTKTHNEGRAGHSLIYRRLLNIKNDTNYEFLTPNAIKQSGMIKLAADYYFEHGDIPKDLLAEIAEHFHINKTKNNGYLVYNYRMLREFINEEKILELYGN